MPYIDVKLPTKLDGSQKDTLKARLGNAVSILNKSECYFMVGIDDCYTLYFGGKKWKMVHIFLFRFTVIHRQNYSTS